MKLYNGDYSKEKEKKVFKLFTSVTGFSLYLTFNFETVKHYSSLQYCFNKTFKKDYNVIYDIDSFYSTLEEFEFAIMKEFDFVGLAIPKNIFENNL